LSGGICAYYDQIGDTSFENATSAASIYAAMSAMVLHLNLDRPSKDIQTKGETVLIWGGSSTIGFYAIQIAAQVLQP
jgi:NADPH:quinone reductase-like Zn-dependent oxidoreductase